MATQQTPAAHVDDESPGFDNEFKVSWDSQWNLVIQSKAEPWINQVVRITNATGDHEAVLTLTFEDDSPFTVERARVVIKQDEVGKLVKNGRFFCGCTLNYPDGTQKGWKITDGTNSKQGGVVVIRP
jgi:hypothetical protein